MTKNPGYLVMTSGAARRWHIGICEALAVRGIAAALQEARSVSPPNWRLAIASRLSPPILDQPGEARPGFPPSLPAQRILAPDGAAEGQPGDLEFRFDGRPGIDQARQAALAGHSPEIAIADAVSGLTLARGRAALERPHLYGPSLDSILARATELLVQLLVNRPQAAPLPDLSPGLPAAAGGLPGHLLRRFGVPLRQRFERLSGRRPEWRTGWRQTSSGVFTAGAEAGNWHWLSQGSDRFFADPFPLWRDGVLHCFVEELPFATGKGVISHFTVSPEGTPSVPRMVLACPCHLSYPFLFEHGPDVFMIPETSTAGTIELYRAAPFPDRWVLEKVLAKGAPWSDATLVEHGDLWWLFATEAGPSRSTWDTLVLFHAPTPFGPFTPHRSNPVLIDAGAARPAGPMFRHDGNLIRPFQDCRSGYGAGLGFARVDRLDVDGFSQTVLARHAPPPDWQANGFHHVASAGGWEFVDRKSVRPD